MNVGKWTSARFKNSLTVRRTTGERLFVVSRLVASAGRTRGSDGVTLAKRSHKINVLSVGTFVGSDDRGSHAKLFSALSKLLGALIIPYTPHLIVYCYFHTLQFSFDLKVDITRNCCCEKQHK